MPFETYPSELRTKSHDDGSVSPRATEIVEKSVVAAEPRRRPPFVTRSSSLNGTELDVLSTAGTAQVTEPVIKRHSISMIPGYSNIWQPTVEVIGEVGTIKSSENSEDG